MDLDRSVSGSGFDRTARAAIARVFGSSRLFAVHAVAPGVRGVPFTMPYGHGGSFGGLNSTVDAHRTGGLDPSSPYAVGDADPYLVAFDATLVNPIVTFLETLRLDPLP
jgi:hypothetical protein